MKKLNVTVIRASVLTVFIALSATHASADTFTYSSGLFGGFNRPEAGVPPTTLSGIIVPFNAQMFMVSLDGTYNFTLTALFNDFVPVLVLYENSFDPSTPLSNALIASGPPFSFDLSAGTTYSSTHSRKPQHQRSLRGHNQWPGEDYIRGWRGTSRANHDVATGHGTCWSSRFFQNS